MQCHVQTFEASDGRRLKINATPGSSKPVAIFRSPIGVFGMSRSAPDKATLRHYVQRKLSGSDEESVELWLMDHPEAVEDLSLDLALQLHMEPGPVSRTAPQWALWEPLFQWLRRPAIVGLAMSSVLGLGLALMLVNQGERSADMRPVQVVDLYKIRGNGQPVIELVQSAEKLLILRVYADESTQGPFSIEIRTDEQTYLVENLYADNMGAVAISVERQLRSGSWDVQLNYPGGHTERFAVTALE